MSNQYLDINGLKIFKERIEDGVNSLVQTDDESIQKTNNKLSSIGLSEDEIKEIVGNGASIIVNEDKYYTKDDVDAALLEKVDIVDGKGLSTNDLTEELKNSYDSAAQQSHSHLNKSVLDNTTASFTTSLQSKLNDIDTSLYGTTFSLDINDKTYEMTIQLKNGDTVLNEEKIDLPLETMVIGATYLDSSKEIQLTLQNGEKTSFSVSSLVSGLVPTSRTIAGINLRYSITADELKNALELDERDEIINRFFEHYGGLNYLELTDFLSQNTVNNSMYAYRVEPNGVIKFKANYTPTGSAVEHKLGSATVPAGTYCYIGYGEGINIGSYPLIKIKTSTQEFTTSIVGTSQNFTLNSAGTIEFYMIFDNSIPTGEEAFRPVITLASLSDMVHSGYFPPSSYIYAMAKEKITSPKAAQVGQALIVKAVDDKGQPTEWETVTLGSQCSYSLDGDTLTITTITS